MNKGSGFALLPALTLLLAFVTPAAFGAASGARNGDPSVYRSASSCEECHREIVRTWRASHHASAFTDPAFQRPYERLRRESPQKAVLCENCHNPMRFLLSPDDPRAAIFAREGVTCDFCHSVESVRPSGPFPRYKAHPGKKFGPQGGRTGKSTHATRFSSLHITSEFCEGCHEFRNGHGVAVLTTVSEWRESFYRGEGIHCQFCHLPQLFDARFIDPDRRTGPLDHEMVGGHSRERLARAIPVRATLRTSGKEARLTVTLKNETVGHKTPSGIPLHRIRLVSTLYDRAGNPAGKKEEVFEKVLGDGTGKPVVLPEDVFTIAREILADNRLAPKETRTVVQDFPAGAAAPVTAEISLVYEIPAPDLAPGLRSIDIPISRTVVPAEPGIAWRPAALAVAAVLLGIAAAAVYARVRRR